jgi:hypothetical protein
MSALCYRKEVFGETVTRRQIPLSFMYCEKYNQNGALLWLCNDGALPIGMRRKRKTGLRPKEWAKRANAISRIIGVPAKCHVEGCKHPVVGQMPDGTQHCTFHGEVMN